MVRVRFYPVEISYATIADKPVVQLFGRTEEGRRICVVDEGFQPYFWVLPEGNAKKAAEEIAKIRADEREVAGTEVQEKYFFGKKVELDPRTSMPAYPSYSNLIWSI